MEFGHFVLLSVDGGSLTYLVIKVVSIEKGLLSPSSRLAFRFSSSGIGWHADAFVVFRFSDFLCFYFLFFFLPFFLCFPIFERKEWRICGLSKCTLQLLSKIVVGIGLFYSPLSLRLTSIFDFYLPFFLCPFIDCFFFY